MWKQLTSFYNDQSEERRSKEKEKNKRNTGPDANVVGRSYLGELVNFVERMNTVGTISTTKAAVVLGVKPLRVSKIFGAAVAR